MKTRLTESAALFLLLIQSFILFNLAFFLLSAELLSCIHVAPAHLVHCIALSFDFVVLLLLIYDELGCVGLQAPVDVLHPLNQHYELYILGLDEFLCHLQTANIDQVSEI